MSDSATLWTVAHQALLSMGFSRKAYWIGLPRPPPRDPPNPRTEPSLICLLHWLAGSLPLGPTWKALSLCVCVLVTQLCSTLCDPMDYSPAGYSVHGILQARILEWVTIPFFKRSSRPRDLTWVSCIADRFFTAEPLGKLLNHQWIPIIKMTKPFKT